MEGSYPMSNKIGVLVMSYGTPESMDRVEAYYTHIRRGSPPPEELLQELKDRYEAIGGLFPLRDNTNKQVQALEAELNARAAAAGDDVTYVCYQGLKHAAPYIEDGVKRMAEDGIRLGVGIVLAPHYSIMSVGGYIQRAKEAAEQIPGMDMRFVKSYHLHPQLLDALVERVENSLKQFSEEERGTVRAIFSAHSLPTRILEMGDPYPEQLLETSRAVAERAGVSQWQFGWQSAGRTSTPWLGPDILDMIRDLNANEGVQSILLCPVGFVSDHLEVLYDVDIEAQAVAKQLGVHLERTASLNVDPRYMAALADVVQEQLS
jgi:protoporphyrin/coproporphyrin ferrochelatase